VTFYCVARAAGRFRSIAERMARPQAAAFDVVDAKTGEVVFPAGQKMSPRAANKAGKDGLEVLLIPTEEIFGRYSAYDLVNDATGEIYIEAGDEVSPEALRNSTRRASTASSCSTSIMSPSARGCATR
jgi:hypothetical protein